VSGEKPLTYQEARRRYRIDRAAILVESAEGERFVPEDEEDKWSDERQAGLESLLQRTRRRLAAKAS